MQRSTYNVYHPYDAMIQPIRIILLIVACVLSFNSLAAQSSHFISTKSQTLQVSHKPYYFIGTNYLYGSLLGLEKDKRRGIMRLRKETRLP
jgi:mannan endo-1,4-beta-mannosidase